MQCTVTALAEIVGGRVRGDGTVLITGARPISSAGPGDITFVESERYARLLGESKASAAVVELGFESDPRPLIQVGKPLEAFIKIKELFQGPKREMPLGVHPQACVAASARLGQDARIGPFVMVGEGVTIGERCRLMPGAVVGDGCRLGDDVTLHPHTVLYPGTVLGNRVVVHAGSVLGSDGFGYRPQAGRHVKVPQLGHVEIGDDVEIGANTTIDRGTFDETLVGEGTKIDNLVQIAHNCHVGRHNIIVAQVGLAGSCKTGDYVVIAGQAGVKDHITIGDRVILEAMSGVMEDVPAGEKWVGIPAGPARDQFRLVGLIRKLPEMREKLAALAQQIEAVQQKIEPKKKSA